MDEARAVVDRLARIERLAEQGAPAERVREEVRRLLTEAEAWARAEGGGAERALAAVRRCEQALARGRAPLGAR